MDRETIQTEKYDYIVIDDLEISFKRKLKKAQDLGYIQDGNILVYEDVKKLIKYSCVMKKLIYKAEVYNNGIEQKIIREYHYN